MKTSQRQTMMNLPKIEVGRMVQIKNDTYDQARAYYEVTKIEHREGFSCPVATVQSIYPAYPQEELITDLIAIEISDERIKQLKLEWGSRQASF